MTNSTLDYYQHNTRKVIKRYEEVDMSKLQERLKSSFKSTSKLLEIGCGSGRDAAALHKLGYDIIITDASENMLLEAVRNHPEFKDRKIILKLPDNFPFDNESFEGIYAIATLMHLDINELKASFTECNRVLMTTGRLFFSIPLNRDDINKEGFDKQGRLFTLLKEEEWVNLCIRAGFELINVEKNWDNMGRSGILWGSFLFQKVRNIH